MVDRPSKFALEIIKNEIPLFLLLRGHYWLKNEWNAKTIYKNWFIQKLLDIRFEVDKKVFLGATVILPLCNYLVDVVKEYYPKQNASVFIEGIDGFDLINNNDSSTNLTTFTFNEVENIIKYRCGVCHASNPTFDGFEDPPAGLVFDTTQDIINNIDGIKSQSIDSDIMPPGNLTGMTENERQKLAEWIKAGAPINN